jgi:hypothetical protein
MRFANPQPLHLVDALTTNLFPVFTPSRPEFFSGSSEPLIRRTSMAYAAYRESLGANLCHIPSGERGQSDRLVVLDFTVPSSDAFAVRRLLAACPDAGVVRCVPRPHDSLVRLEIQLPAHRAPEVMHLLMSALPSGELGPLTWWQRHLTDHGMTHGF